MNKKIISMICVFCAAFILTGGTVVFAEKNFKKNISANFIVSKSTDDSSLSSRRVNSSLSTATFVGSHDPYVNGKYKYVETTSYRVISSSNVKELDYDSNTTTSYSVDAAVSNIATISNTTYEADNLLSIGQRGLGSMAQYGIQETLMTLSKRNASDYYLPYSYYQYIYENYC